MGLLKPAGSVSNALSGIAQDIVGSSGESASQRYLGVFQGTAYGPPWDTMNGTGVTSQGTDLRGQSGVGKYIVAVDPTVIPYGTKVKASPNPFGDPNIVFLADDTGGAFQGGVKKIDFFDWRGRSYQYKWGSRPVKVWAVTGSTSPSGVVGAAGAVGDALGAVDAAADFTGDMVSTLLNFRKLGELAAKACAWFVRLIAKAIWDYVIAPLVHWAQRAVSYYWETYFSKNPGGGFIKQSAGVITLMFWGMGYGILWASVDPTPKMMAPARETLLGRTIRSAEGQLARRNLIKPSKVKEKTPTKPTPTLSSVSIERTNEFAASRKRPVKVEGKGSNDIREEETANV